ncbi:GGDEF domain-containing protein, partial [Lachnospiraceae bacterium OttesenSCG-928-E19]|nr:GGDEF domain-containing protein [Lachnospiraceae bacterium OttesenSCG-928-E19]
MKMILKNKYLKHIVSITIGFSLVIFCFVTGMNWKNSRGLQIILEDSVKSQLISIAYAAQEIIDTRAFMSYNSIDDIEAKQTGYTATLKQLRLLAEDVNAEYIYVLKSVDEDTAVFVFDTDTENEEVFIPYELSDIHMEAFAGKDTAGILNLSDEYGSYNSGAIPLRYNDEIVGIVCVDLEDQHIRAAKKEVTLNTIILSAALLITLGVMIYGMKQLTRQIQQMRDKLEEDARYDAVTGLPNRKYLMEYLADTIKETPGEPFALLFIDLDNFKQVNDNAGHDAGDELLKHIGQYLSNSVADSQAFRPSAGQLNIAARVGGDEFIQIVRNVSTEEDAARVATQLLEGFKNQNFDRHIDKYNVGMSIGVALYPFHSENFHVLIKYADAAMYHSKRGGKNTYTLYDESL